jgi:hypothetical protein
MYHSIGKNNYVKEGINMHDEFNSVSDIDAALDQEFGITDDVDLDTQDDESSQDVDLSDETSTIDEEDNDTEDESSHENVEGPENGTTDQNNEEGLNKKPDNEAKKGYAFAQLRKQNEDLRHQLDENNKNTDILKAIAKEYGYDDVNSFYKDYEDARLAKEAKEKGIDADMYKQLHDSNKRIAELEEAERKRSLITAAEKFKTAVDKAVVDYNLGEDGSNEIFDKLEEAGYDVTTILKLPNPDIVIKGVLADKIVKISEQKQIEKINKLDTVADGRHGDMSDNKSFNLDDFIDSDLEDYKANNYFE